MWISALALLNTPAFPAPAAEDPASAETAGPRLPVLVSWARPAYPERALERALEGDVLLELTVDEEGYVTDVQLVEGAGHGFDGPATASAWTMLFDPARDERGRPSPAVIRYRVPFRMDDVVPLSVSGQVRERGEKKKVLANARIKAVGPDEAVARTVSDDKGEFRLAGLAPGTWILTVDGPGLITSSASVEVPADGYTDGVALSVERIPDWEEGDQVFDEYVEVVAETVPEPAERVISHDLVVSLPGSLGDPVRALQNLPGVARAPFGSGQLLVRGTDASDTGYFLDGVEIPIAFHFTAVSTVVPADLLTGVELSTGGFGARYGRALGGVVELDTNDDLPRRSSTSISADVFQATVFSRQRLGKNVSLSLSARRSYIDAILQPVLTGMGADAIRVPKFYDATVHLVRALEGRGRVVGTFMLSEDRFRLLSETGVDAVVYRTAFQKGIFRWIQPTGAGWTVETTLGAGPEVQEIELSGETTDLGTLGVPVDLFGKQAGVLREEGPFRWSFRHEWARDPGEGHVGARFGTDWLWGRQGYTDTLGDDADEFASAGVSQPAFYAEPIFRFGPIDLVPGVRAEVLRIDGSSARISSVTPSGSTVSLETEALGSAHGVVDPRLRTILRVGGSTEVVAYGGSYSQPPAPRELLASEDLGGGRIEGWQLGFERSFLVGGGVDQRLGPDAELGVGIYHQTLWDLVAGRDNLFRFDQTSLTPPEILDPFANVSTGTGYGLEVHGRWTDERWLLWWSSTLSRSLRVPLPGEEPRPAEADQPVNLVAIASRALGKSRVGARLRYVSGTATTPVLGGAYLMSEQEWLPIYGDAWSERLPSYFAVDLRVDRELRWGKSTVNLYGELQNATNHGNVELAGYSPDWSEFRPTYGLPIFPAFGLKVTW